MKKILFLWVFFYSTAICFAKEPVNIRVAVIKDKTGIVLSVGGAYEILNAHTQETLACGKNFASAKIVVDAQGLRVRDKVFKTDALLVTSRKKAAIGVNGRTYRGDISVYKETSGDLLVVNTLDVESYIKGVLYHEISHMWPIDAIKAQAVAARTYAMYQKEVMRLKEYDVTADTSSQVYGGYSSEKHKTNRAVNFTYGEVLTYQGKVFPAYFHATCGGTLENASELWKIDIEPLKGGYACFFCIESPHYFWKTAFDLKTIQKKLRDRYAFKGDLKSIDVAERTGTGRLRSLTLVDVSGARQMISAKDFRAVLGSDAIRSTNFTIVIDEDKVVFNGKGWGHGVGLCQWGAYGMSQKGYHYQQILEFYYPGTKLVKML